MTIVTVTNNFRRWSETDINLNTLHLKEYSVRSEFKKELIAALKAYGLKKDTTINLMGNILADNYSGYARFRELDFVQWYWDNGDNIMFPINSHGSIYLGNDNAIWCNYWPFLEKSVNDIMLNNCMEKVTDISDSENKLFIGGQAHFGHFIVNKIAPLVQTNQTTKFPYNNYKLIVSPGQEDLHKYIIKHTLGYNTNNILRMPRCNGRIKLYNVIIPSLNIDGNSIGNLQGIVSNNAWGKRKIDQKKRIYITRNVDPKKNGRIYNSEELYDYLERQEFKIIDVTNLTGQDRSEILGNAEKIITDSGSCGLNAFLFGHKDSIIYNLIPKRVLSSTDPHITNQLETVLSHAINRIWIDSESTVISKQGPWNDKCRIDIKRLDILLKQTRLIA